VSCLISMFTATCVGDWTILIIVVVARRRASGPLPVTHRSPSAMSSGPSNGWAFDFRRGGLPLLCVSRQRRQLAVGGSLILSEVRFSNHRPTTQNEL